MTHPDDETPVTIPYRLRPDHRVLSVGNLTLMRPQQSGTGIVVVEGYMDVTEILEQAFRVAPSGSYHPHGPARTQHVREHVVTLYVPEFAVRSFAEAVMRDARTPNRATARKGSMTPR